MGSKTRSFGLWFLLSLPLLFNQGCGGASEPTEFLTQQPPPGEIPSPTPSPTPSPDTSAELLWEPAARSEDGSPLTDLAGYRVYFGKTSPLSKASSSWVPVDSGTIFTFTDLEPGTTYFAVTAVDIVGNESDFSNEGSKTVL